jgi:hypothetical protein
MYDLGPVSRLSTKIELWELTTATTKIVWLWWLLVDFGISCAVATPLPYDNTWALQIANDPMKHELKNHNSVDAFFTLCHCYQKTIYL